MRAAALEAMVAAGRASFSVADLSEALYWLDETSPRTVCRRCPEAL